MKAEKLFFTLMLALLMQLPAQAMAAGAATVEQISGKAWATHGTQRREIGKGDEVAEGDTISTGKRSALSIRFKDRTFFALGEKSEMEISKFSFEQATTKNSLLTRIVQGSFRFISGLVAKTDHDAMTVRAGVVASIGIRGTHVGGEVTPRKTKGDKVVKEESAQIVLLEPEGEQRPTSIEVSNEYGSEMIDKPGYGTDIADEHSAPTPPRKIQIRTLQRINRALRNATRVPRGMP